MSRKKSEQVPAAMPEAGVIPVAPLTSPLVLHRTFEKSDRGEPTYYVVGTDGKVVKKEGDDVATWIESLDANSTVRLTSLSTYIPVLMGLADRGVKLLHANWHRTGIEKGLAADKIALRFAALDASLFQEFKPRKDLLTLRRLVNIRAALMAYRIAAYQKIVEDTRSLGFTDSNKPSWLAEAETQLKADVKETESPIEKEISKLAKSIPECILLNKIMAISDNSWLTSATVIGFLQDIGRFATVAKLWHYCGYHVVDGHAPKRKAGVAMTWNTDLRTALWKWADSMLKTKNPVWRPVYEKYLAEEDARHPAKCSKDTCGGGSRTGHIGARARRRVVKDVLSELWIQVHSGYDPGMKVQVSPTVRSVSPVHPLSAEASASGD